MIFNNFNYSRVFSKYEESTYEKLTIGKIDPGQSIKRMENKYYTNNIPIAKLPVEHIFPSIECVRCTEESDNVRGIRPIVRQDFNYQFMHSAFYCNSPLTDCTTINSLYGKFFARRDHIEYIVNDT